MIEPVARIRIELQDLEPKIWQRIDVPISTTLAALHDIIQVAFCWADSHLHEFVVSDRVHGARRCPPEDVGWTDGFMEFLEAALNPGHEEHKRLIEWYSRLFDPAEIDKRRVRMVIGNFAARRRGPLSSHRRGGGKIRA